MATSDWRRAGRRPRQPHQPAVGGLHAPGGGAPPMAKWQFAMVNL